MFIILLNAIWQRNGAGIKIMNALGNKDWYVTVTNVNSTTVNSLVIIIGIIYFSFLK